MNSDSPHTESIFQFLKFSLVGISNGIVDFFVYIVLTRLLFSAPEFIIPAKAVSYLAATVWSFFVNRHFTFKLQHAWRMDELARYMGSVGFGIFINVGVQYLAVFVFGLNDLIGFFLAAFGTGVWGFTLSKLYVFKKKGIR